MRKIIPLFLMVTCLFALFLHFTDGGVWSWRVYFEFVTANIEPFPHITLSVSFDPTLTGVDKIVAYFDYLWALVSYPFELIVVVVHNVQVLLSGFFPVVIEEYLSPSLDIVKPSIWETIFPNWLTRWF